MGKARNRSNKQQENASSTHLNNQKYQNENSNSLNNDNNDNNNNKNNNITTPRRIGFSSSSSSTMYYKILSDWVYEERYGLAWITSCILLGFLLGLSIGTGYITGAYGVDSVWRQTLANRIRTCYWYEITQSICLLIKYIISNIGRPYKLVSNIFEGKDNSKTVQINALDHKFYALREMIIREDGGYVHPDLGFLIPAPSGAERGLGFVRSSYESCQRCFVNETTTSNTNRNGDDDNNVLLRIPSSIQMTRSLALSTLIPLLPPDVQRRVPLEDLDDAALLVLLLAHERSKDIESRFYPYIATLPKNPTCGYASYYRHEALKNIVFLGQELGMDVNGWHAEVMKASDYADRIANALSRDYGVYILNNIHNHHHPMTGRIHKSKFQSMAAASSSAFAAIQWSLCQVSSRATAANVEFGGALRLIPLLDLVNHDAEAAGFHEIITPAQSSGGDDNSDNDDNGNDNDSYPGAFTLRSTRHGIASRVRQGKELMANYNVPNFSPLDWFINIGYVPPERTHRWVKLDAALPRQYTRRSTATAATPTAGSDTLSKNYDKDQPDNSDFFTTKDVPAGGTRLNVVTTNSDGESTTHHFHIQNDL